MAANEYLNQSDTFRSFRPDTNVEDDESLTYETGKFANSLFKSVTKNRLDILTTNLQNYQQNVAGTIRQSLSIIDESHLSWRVDEEGFQSLQEQDAKGQTIAFQTEAGHRYLYAYDALGRLRKVGLPGGARHLISYDHYGRLESITRDEIGGMQYHYNQRNQLTEITYFDSNSNPERQNFLSYDSKGRIIEERYQSDTGNTVYQYRYDGDRTGGVSPSDQLGFLSEVSGVGWTRRMQYYPDGKPESSDHLFSGYGAASFAWSYMRDGSVKDQSVIIKHADGKQRLSYQIAYQYQEDGLLDKVSSSLGSSLKIERDEHGRIAALEFDKDQSITIVRDPLTRSIMGYEVEQGAAKTLSYSLMIESRGMVAEETYKDAEVTQDRDYKYTDEKFLQSTTIGSKTYENLFSEDALALAIADPFGSSSWKQLQNSEQLGFDSSGRVTRYKDWRFEYGPAGHVTKAANSTTELRYLYSEEGTRILKLKNSKFSYLRAADLWLTENQSFALLPLEDTLLAAVYNGQIVPFISDARGSLIVDSEGKLSAPSAFGRRGEDVAEHPFARFADYAMSGRDLDTGLVRMGVRDYSSDLGRFLTPDPLFFESPELCIERPLECNLYSYAKNNPLKYNDPTGKVAETVIDVASIAAGVFAISQWDETTSWWSKAADVGGLVLDTAAAALPFVPGGVGLGLKATRGADKALDSQKLLNPPINITNKGFKHTIERHTDSGIAKFADKSKFNSDINIKELIQSATQKPVKMQRNGNSARTFDTGKNIGVDMSTGKQTSIMTVITDKKGDLVTSFPGSPK